MARKKTKVYKLVSKYRKNPDLLLEHGFNYYESDEKDVKLYAIPILLTQDSPLFTQCVKFMEKIYEEATSEQRKEDFKDFTFKLELQPDQHNEWRLQLTDDLIQEFSQAQICVVIEKGVEDSTLLFVNSPLKDPYYNAQTIKETAPEIIDELLKEKVIYERRHIYNSR